MDSFLTGLEEIKNKTSMVWMPPALSVPTRKTPKKQITEQSKGLSNMNSEWFSEKGNNPIYCFEKNTTAVFWKWLRSCWQRFSETLHITRSICTVARNITNSNTGLVEEIHYIFCHSVHGFKVCWRRSTTKIMWFLIYLEPIHSFIKCL